MQFSHAARSVDGKATTPYGLDLQIILGVAGTARLITNAQKFNLKM